MKYPLLDIAFKRRSHRIFKEIIQAYANGFPKILDVGCNSGVVGRLLCHKTNIFGVEFNEALADLAQFHCEKVYHINLEKINESDIAEGDFDFIIFGDVLEHLRNPRHVVTLLAKRLKKNGLIIISLPNIAQLPYRMKLLFGNFDYTETGILDKTHVHLYTYKTALQLIKDCGLSIKKFYPSGTIVSFLNILPRLLCSQFVFSCQRGS